MLAEVRRAEIVEMLRTQRSVSVAEVERQLGVSRMTARRDLGELARRGMAVRTHGGAVLPSISAQEDSFSARLDVETDAKLALARAAVELISPRDAVFVDSSSTGYFVARRILDLGLELTIITNSLPVTQLVATRSPSNVELIGIGGMLRQLTQSFVGPDAVRAIQGHFCDHAFLSVKALTPNGMLVDADPLEAEVKRTMIAQAQQPALLISASKLAARGLNAIGAVSEVSLVLAHGITEAEMTGPQRAGVALRVLPATAPAAATPTP